MQPIESFLADASSAPEAFDGSPWYNDIGDCIEYQTQDVEIIADRIDSFLTIYRSVEDEKSAVGFKIKDVSALMKKLQCDTMSLTIETENTQLKSVLALLLRAFEETKPISIQKRNGYHEAMSQLVTQS